MIFQAYSLASITSMQSSSISCMQVIASMPGASQQTSAAILSSLAFNGDAGLFASAGVSKRIFVYNFNDVVETYGGVGTGQASPKGALKACTHCSQVLSHASVGPAHPVQTISLLKVLPSFMHVCRTVCPGGARVCRLLGGLWCSCGPAPS